MSNVLAGLKIALYVTGVFVLLTLGAALLELRTAIKVNSEGAQSVIAQTSLTLRSVNSVVVKQNDYLAEEARALRLTTDLTSAFILKTDHNLNGCLNCPLGTLQSLSYAVLHQDEQMTNLNKKIGDNIDSLASGLNPGLVDWQTGMRNFASVTADPDIPQTLLQIRKASEASASSAQHIDHSTKIMDDTLTRWSQPVKRSLWKELLTIIISNAIQGTVQGAVSH